MDTTRSRQIGIGHHGRKTDRPDADRLALALEQGHLPAAHLLSPERQEMRHHLGVRRMLVESRAQAVTTVRGIVRAHGERVPSCDVEVGYRRDQHRRRRHGTCTPSAAAGR